MAEANTTTAGAGGATTPGAITQADINKAVADALGPVVATLSDLAKNQKVFADTLASLPPAAGSKGTEKASSNSGDGGGGEKPLTRAELTKLLEDHDAASKATAARNAFLGQKLGDLPAAYQARLGNDPAKWAEEEQAIRKEYRGDLEKAGVKAPPVGGDVPPPASSSASASPSASAPGAAVDLSKLSPVQLIERGLKPV